MAYLPDSEVNRLLKKTPLKPLTKRSLTDEKKFIKRLRKIREQGFFVDRGEALDGVTGAAAPIRDYTEKVIAAVGVAIISSSLDSKEIKKMIKDSCETANKISEEMGYIEKPRQNGKKPLRP